MPLVCAGTCERRHLDSRRLPQAPTLAGVSDVHLPRLGPPRRDHTTRKERGEEGHRGAPKAVSSTASRHRRSQATRRGARAEGRYVRTRGTKADRQETFARARGRRAVLRRGTSKPSTEARPLREGLRETRRRRAAHRLQLGARQVEAAKGAARSARLHSWSWKARRTGTASLARGGVGLSIREPSCWRVSPSASRSVPSTCLRTRDPSRDW